MNTCSALALRPRAMLMSIPQMPTTARIEPDLRALAQNQARARGFRSFSKFIEWCVRAAVTLDFLSDENRSFVHQLRQHMGAPWTALDIVNALVAAARKEIIAGNLRPAFWLGQFQSMRNGDGR